MPDLNTYQFSWTKNRDLILYSEDGAKTVISYDKLWDYVKDSDEYKNYLRNHCGVTTWRGKHKTEACFGLWGKALVVEMFRKYKKQIDKDNKQ